jgi:DNA-binding transcriptional regulator YiaG
MTGPEAIKVIQKLGVSQRRFALMIDMHPNAITKWANGGSLSGPAASLLMLLDERPELIEVMKQWRVKK